MDTRIQRAHDLASAILSLTAAANDSKIYPNPGGSVHVQKLVIELGKELEVDARKILEERQARSAAKSRP